MGRVYHGGYTTGVHREAREPLRTLRKRLEEAQGPLRTLRKRLKEAKRPPRTLEERLKEAKRGLPGP